MGKGSKSRVSDHGAFRDNYERIFQRQRSVSTLADEDKATRCTCGAALDVPEFDEQRALEIQSAFGPGRGGEAVAAIRKAFPRKEEACSACGQAHILYASWAHYLAGDW